MQIIGADQPVKFRPIHRFVGATAGTILIVGGLTFEFAAVLTPYVERVATGRFGGTAAAWWIAVTLGAVFLGVGAAQLATVLADIRTKSAGATPVTPIGGGDIAMAFNVDVGDGRPIPKLVVGRFGAAVIRDLPATTVARHLGPYWEGMTEQGWIRIENPLDRASRDAERVRRWFAQDDRDYVIRVYAAAVAPDATLPRTPTCAVITEAQLEPWLRSLPAQRSLTEARRAQLMRTLRAGT